MTQHKSLIHVLEDVVLALESEGQNETEIHSLVNMILKGFLVNGELTEEYKALARAALQHREYLSRTLDAKPTFETGIITSSRG